MKLAALFWLLVVGTPASAHDFWIQPKSFQPAPGSLLEIELMVGDHGQGQGMARNDARTVRFTASGPGDERPIVGRDGARPAGILRVGQPGLYVLAYRSAPSVIELKAEAFERYLHEEGLESISALRAELGQTDQPAREVFSRCAKALVRGAGQGSDGYDRPLGLELELVPAGNPFVSPGEPIEVEVLHAGRPLAGVLVKALCLDAPPGPESQPPAQHQRSDERGRVVLTPDQPGRWLFAAVHMRAAQQDGEPADGPPAQWESLWASLTLEVTPRADG